MKKKRNCIFWGVLIVWLLAGAMFFNRPASGQDDQNTAPCCFAHEGYPNPCKVIPAKDETCESILEYLNTPGTGGKSYCNGSLLRGGWSAVDCDAPSKGDEGQ